MILGPQCYLFLFADSNVELDTSRFEFLENEIDNLKVAISRRDATLREYRLEWKLFKHVCDMKLKSNLVGRMG